GLDIVRILLDERFHRLLVVLRARVLVDGLVILVEGFQRGEPVTLALGLGAYGLTLLHRLESPLERLAGEPWGEGGGSLADRNPPVSDGAGGIRLGNRREGLDRFREEEGVQHGERALELFLCFG